ncbi:MAG: hypothetical protein HYS18_12780 [Burkholderiales bacterium]|nr:hypothetical protein [Burkholderiales bacterium]
MHAVRLFVAVATVFALIARPAAATELDPERLAAIDTHALAANPAHEATPELLAKYLIQPARNDYEKARAIYRWMTDRVSYDVDAYLGKKPMISTEAEDVLKSRSSICDGYASLFERLAKVSGLEAASIKGFAKGYLTAQKGDGKPNHAWNAIKVDGRWHLVDPTWGAGYVRDGRYQKALSELFFLIPPEQLIFSHYPTDSAWQLQSTPRISKTEFETLPALEPAFFHIGVSGQEVWQTLKTPAFRGEFVRTFDIPFRMVQVLQAPLTHHLVSTQAYDFRIRSKAFEKMAAVQGDKWLEMNMEGDTFSLNAAPPGKGPFYIMGKKPGVEQYTAVLAYTID